MEPGTQPTPSTRPQHPHADDEELHRFLVYHQRCTPVEAGVAIAEWRIRAAELGLDRGREYRALGLAWLREHYPGR